jgi:hypothetical protein
VPVWNCPRNVGNFRVDSFSVMGQTKPAVRFARDCGRCAGGDQLSLTASCSRSVRPPQLPESGHPGSRRSIARQCVVVWTFVTYAHLYLVGNLDTSKCASGSPSCRWHSAPLAGSDPPSTRGRFRPVPKRMCESGCIRVLQGGGDFGQRQSRFAEQLLRDLETSVVNELTDARSFCFEATT